MKATRQHKIALLVSVACLAVVAGCYKRTVSTSGIGSYGANVQDSGRSNTAADRWVDSLFAEPKTTKKTRWVETAR